MSLEVCQAVLISLTKTMTKNIRQQTFFMDENYMNTK